MLSLLHALRFFLNSVSNYYWHRGNHECEYGGLLKFLSLSFIAPSFSALMDMLRTFEELFPESVTPTDGGSAGGG